MTYEEYYGQEYQRLLGTQTILETMANQMKNSEKSEEDLQPIVYYCSRIKKPDSMIAKLKSRGFNDSLKSALHDVYDAVGLRIICSFESDVHKIVEILEHHKGITVIEKKDYLSFPKPNGYRSVHLCIKVNETDTLAEIQVRSIAMDCWATLEHQLKYKKSIQNEALIKSELKRCADEIASTDLSLQTIREILNSF